jgi:HSP20 family protein
MPEQAIAATPTKQPATPAPLRLVPPSDLFKRVQQLRDEIARRAFSLFETNGKIFGSDLDNWLRAESELLRPVQVDISEADGNLIVKAEVPGFTSKELDVALEPSRLTISGKREAKEERKDKKTLYTEIRSDQVLRVLDLPASVNTAKATATLKDGVLELKLPKAESARKVEITAKQPNPDQEC